MFCKVELQGTLMKANPYNFTDNGRTISGISCEVAVPGSGVLKVQPPKGESAPTAEQLAALVGQCVAVSGTLNDRGKVVAETFAKAGK